MQSTTKPKSRKYDPLRLYILDRVSILDQIVKKN